jgi:hypothetical protein
LDTAAFDDPQSYQSQALRRTEEQVGAVGFSDSKLVQYFALYCIYSATNGVPNAITEGDPRFEGITVPNWLFDANWDATNEDPCGGNWYGVACSNDRVAGIDLSSNFLTGVFPPEVSLLSSENPSEAGVLRALVLFKNEFLYNNMDNSWISNLGTNLRKYSFSCHTPIVNDIQSFSFLCLQNSDSIFSRDFVCRASSENARESVRV